MPLLIMSDVANTGGRRIRDVNARIAELARRQGGHVTIAQLHELGLRRGGIEARARNSWLIRVHHGVYAVGHVPSSPVDRARAALLAGGPRSALAGRSAAALWALYDRWGEPLELISPQRRRIPELRTRTSNTLLRRDIWVHHGIRVTSPARTLLDLAPGIDERMLHRFHNELRMRRLINNQRLLDVADRNSRHPGARRLRALAAASRGEPKRSQLELDWRAFAERQGLPAYHMNVHVAQKRVDVLFIPDRLIVELDGWGTHGTRQAFEHDRDRDADLLAATGIPTVRITHEGLHRRPSEQASRIRSILARRPG